MKSSFGDVRQSDEERDWRESNDRVVILLDREIGVAYGGFMMFYYT